MNGRPERRHVETFAAIEEVVVAAVVAVVDSVFSPLRDNLSDGTNVIFSATADKSLKESRLSILSFFYRRQLRDNVRTRW